MQSIKYIEKHPHPQVYLRKKITFCYQNDILPPEVISLINLDLKEANLKRIIMNYICFCY